jgi:hypothetical protein
MASNTEGKYNGEFILAECPGTISRSQGTVTVPASTTLSPGQVLGKLTATGKYVPFDNTATDGRESAAGVLYNELVNGTVSAADHAATIIDWSAEVRSSDLAWGTASSVIGLPQLAALGVKARS